MPAFPSEFFSFDDGALSEGISRACRQLGAGLAAGGEN
jgi:hypothetical protein